MQIEYDPEVDVVIIRLREGRIEESDQVAPGVILDMDDNGQPLAIEILNAGRLLNANRKLELPFRMTVG